MASFCDYARPILWATVFSWSSVLFLFPDVFGFRFRGKHRMFPRQTKADKNYSRIMDDTFHQKRCHAFDMAQKKATIAMQIRVRPLNSATK